MTPPRPPEHPPAAAPLPRTPSPPGPIGNPGDAASLQALRAQTDFTRRRLERNAAELLHELKPTSMIRTQLGGHSRAGAPEIGAHMFSKLKKHPVMVSGLVTAATSLLLAGDEVRPGRSLRQRLAGLLGGDDPQPSHDPGPVSTHGPEAGRARPPAIGPAETGPQSGRSAVASASGFVRDNPLLIGGGAVVVGLLIGALIPSTRRELVRLGSAAADGAAERGRAAVDTLQDHLDTHGDGGPLTDRAVTVGRAALAGAKDAVAGAAVAAVAGQLHKAGGGSAPPVAETVRHAAAEVGEAARAAGVEASTEAGLHPDQLKRTARAAEDAAIRG